MYSKYFCILVILKLKFYISFTLVIMIYKVLSVLYPLLLQRLNHLQLASLAFFNSIEKSGGIALFWCQGYNFRMQFSIIIQREKN